MKKDEFYESISRQLESSQIAYEEYLQKRTYLSAKEIKSINESLINFITGNDECIEERDREGFETLLEHYRGWINQFNDEARREEPTDQDEFVFDRREGVVPFPLIFVTELLNRNNANE